MKICLSCHLKKDLSNFSKNIRMLDGLQQRCKSCCKRYREDNKTKAFNRDIQNLQCNKCKQILDICFFSPKINSIRGFDYWCKNCRNYYKQNYYLNNLKNSKNYNNNRKKEKIQWFWSLKDGKPCTDCGYSYEPFCMDYDHLFNKLKNISRMVLENASKEVIIKEISKCELVCCLCHNIRTQKRLDDKYPEKKYTPTILRNIEIINKIKSSKCYKCGIQRGLCNMQFDHIDPSTKFRNVSQLKSFKLKTLLLEVNKCKVICALCHRKKSICEQRSGKYSEKRKKVLINKIAPLVSDGFAWCSRCGFIKEVNYFTMSNNTKTGYNAWCKACFNNYRKDKRRLYNVNICLLDK